MDGSNPSIRHSLGAGGYDDIEHGAASLDRLATPCSPELAPSRLPRESLDRIQRMEDLIRERIPHAPQMGLFVRPDIPDTRLTNAVQDYAQHVRSIDVIALYDATLSGNGKDGAVFASDRFVFQNTDLEAPQTVRYRDLIEVEAKRRWMGLGGKKVELTVNRGRATFDLVMDFSGQPDAADYIAEFLDQAASADVTLGRSATPSTDLPVVEAALARLKEQGALSSDDMKNMLDAIQQSPSEPESAPQDPAESAEENSEEG